jgi:hypothetical protein
LFFHFLGDLLSVRPENIVLDPFNGALCIDKAQLHHEVFADLHLPFSVKGGIIDHLRVRIPIKSGGILRNGIKSSVLTGYDKDMYPTQQLGTPTWVDVQVLVLDVSHIDPTDNDFRFRAELVQTWNDTRLAYSHMNYSNNIDHLLFSGAIPNGWEVWRPPNYWPSCSGVQVFVETYRVYPTGNVVYFQVVETVCKCAIDLGKMPFGSQACPVPLVGFGIPVEEVRLFSSTKTSVSEGIEDPHYMNFDATCYSDTFIPHDNPFAQSRVVTTFTFDHKYHGDILCTILPAMIFSYVAYGNFYIFEAPPRIMVSIVCTLIHFVLLSKVEASLPATSASYWEVAFLYGCLFFNFVAVFCIFMLDYISASAKMIKAKAEQEASSSGLNGLERLYLHIDVKGFTYARRLYPSLLLLYFIIMFSVIPAFGNKHAVTMTSGDNRVDCGGPTPLR